MRDANSADMAQFILLSVLAVGVALFAVLDDSQARASQEHERTHLTVWPVE